jgi:hypothetical protein
MRIESNPGPKSGRKSINAKCETVTDPSTLRRGLP